VTFQTRLRGGYEVKRNIIVLLTFGMLLLTPNLILADCVNIRGITSWIPEDTHTILLYWVSNPIARVNVPYCTVYPTSTIRLLKNYNCDGDKIIIDGTECTISTIKSPSFSSY
jgi:hypothetical protein